MSLKVKFFLLIFAATIVPTILMGLLPLNLLSTLLSNAGLSPDQVGAISERMRDTILAYSFFLAVSFSFFAFMIYRLLGEPLADLIAGMKQIRSRNFAGRVPVVATGDIGELGDSFNEMAQQLERHVSELESTSRMKDEFLALLSHELRNPLAGIVSSLELIQLKAGTAIEEDTKKVFSVAERQIDILKRLLDDLLNVSRLTRGLLSIHKAPLDLRTVIESVALASTPLIQQAQVRLAVSTPREPVTIDGDSVRLEQALLNLIKNATEHSTPNTEVAIELSQGEDHAQIAVRDQGSGIQDTMFPKLFTLFSRGTSPKQGGLGVGLYLVKNIIERHGGTVGAKNAIGGNGAEFVIDLPLAA